MRLNITVFVDSFGYLIATTDEDIDNFVCDTQSSNSARAASVRIVIQTKVSTSIKTIRFELKDCELCNILLDEDTLDAIDMAKINIFQ